MEIKLIYFKIDYWREKKINRQIYSEVSVHHLHLYQRLHHLRLCCGELWRKSFKQPHTFASESNGLKCFFLLVCPLFEMKCLGCFVNILVSNV